MYERLYNKVLSQRQAALDLLGPLLKVVMIRHSKSQRHVDGSELTSLPPNNIQWQSLPLGRDSAAFTVRAALSTLRVFRSNSIVYGAFVWARAGRLTAKNGGFRPLVPLLVWSTI